MPTATDVQSLMFKDWTFRLRPAQKMPGRLLILLHGWTGDENSMWVLAPKLPPQYSVLAPRAPYPATERGYSWREMKPGIHGLPTLNGLRPAAESLLKFIDEWSATLQMDTGQFDLMGFSQGSAFTMALALLYPARVRSLVVLSGFLPDGAEALLAARPWAGKSVFVSHGRQDELIPVEQARRFVTLLEASGVRVTYCESDGGHKVGKECVHELERFFR